MVDGWWARRYRFSNFSTNGNNGTTAWVTITPLSMVVPTQLPAWVAWLLLVAPSTRLLVAQTRRSCRPRVSHSMACGACVGAEL